MFIHWPLISDFKLLHHLAGAGRDRAPAPLLAVGLALLGGGGVVVQALRHEVHGQRVLAAVAFLILARLFWNQMQSATR